MLKFLFRRALRFFFSRELKFFFHILLTVPSTLLLSSGWNFFLFLCFALYIHILLVWESTIRFSTICFFAANPTPEAALNCQINSSMPVFRSELLNRWFFFYGANFVNQSRIKWWNWWFFCNFFLWQFQKVGFSSENQEHFRGNDWNVFERHNWHLIYLMNDKILPFDFSRLFEAKLTTRVTKTINQTPHTIQ